MHRECSVTAEIFWPEKVRHTPSQQHSCSSPSAWEAWRRRAIGLAPAGHSSSACDANRRRVAAVVVALQVGQISISSPSSWLAISLRLVAAVGHMQ